MSMSTVGALESYFDDDVSENMHSESGLSIADVTNRDYSDPSTRRRPYYIIIAFASVATVIIAFVKFTELIPQIHHLRNAPRKSDSIEIKYKKLKALSTGKFLFFITWRDFRRIRY
jgi:hypothetical protein